MKTITELPALPKGWRWVQGRGGCWDPIGPELHAALVAGRLAGLALTTGTPRVGATVLDPETGEEVLYQPETT